MVAVLAVLCVFSRPPWVIASEFDYSLEMLDRWLDQPTANQCFEPDIRSKWHLFFGIFFQYPERHILRLVLPALNYETP
jgi:hypothetical protein